MLQTPLPFLLHMDSTDLNNRHLHVRGTMPAPVLEVSDNESSVSASCSSFFLFLGICFHTRVTSGPVIVLLGVDINYIIVSFFFRVTHLRFPSVLLDQSRISSKNI